MKNEPIIMSMEKFDKILTEMKKKTNEAKAKGVCTMCRKNAMENCYSEAGKAEYNISGLCEKCFDILFDK